MTKVSFVEPKTPNFNVFSKSITMPLMGPVYLSTMLKNAGHDTTVYNENISTVLSEDGTLDQGIVQSDVLIITSLTSTAPRGYKIAEAYKRANPSGKVIIGGIHATFMPEEAAQYADLVCTGEGEEIIFEALETKEKILAGRPLSDMDLLPTPDFSLIKGFDVKMAPIMTSRGCPYNCNFCSVTPMFGRGYRFRSTKKVIEDLQQIKHKNIFFYDDHFVANRERTKDLLLKMKENGIDKRWDAQVRADVANDEELLGMMADTGCDMVYIGMESVNEKTLQAYHKSQNLGAIQKAIKRLHDYGIKLHGMFVLGSEHDDAATIKSTVEFSEANEIDSVQYAILTPLPGTEVYTMLNNQGRLITRDWSFYDGLHAVFRPKLMSAYELQARALDAMKEFYSASKGYKIMLKNSASSGARTVRNWFYEKKRKFPEMKRALYKIVGSRIISKWESTNKSYMDFLKKYRG